MGHNLALREQLHKISLNSVKLEFPWAYGFTGYRRFPYFLILRGVRDVTQHEREFNGASVQT
jgi:hypothetical protein